TFEAAREGSHRLRVSYQERAPAATFGSADTQTVAAATVLKNHEDPVVGDAPGAFASAPVKLDVQYATATEHHNPIELFTTTCAWSNGKLTVWESSQNMWGI